MHAYCNITRCIHFAVVPPPATPNQSLTMDQSTAVISKLQSAIARFRREKDAAQRNRDLALERLQSSTATLQTEEGKTATLQSTLEGINRKIAAGNGKEIVQKRTENERLERETNFQHTELVRKKEKLSALRAKMEEESARRSANVRSVRRSVKMWREKNSVQQTSNLLAVTDVTATGGGTGAGGGNEEEAAAAAAAAATAAAIDKLNTILTDCQQERGGEEAASYLELLQTLPKLIEDKTALLVEEVADLERRVEQRKFVEGRYRAELDVVADGNGGVGVGGEKMQLQQDQLQDQQGAMMAMDQQQQEEQMMAMEQQQLEQDQQQQQFQPMQEPIEAAYM